MACKKQDIVNIVTELLQEHDKVYMALGCSRTYVGAVPSELCKRCNGVHTNHEISSIADLDNMCSDGTFFTVEDIDP